MANSFSQPVLFDKKALLVVVVPQLRKDGMYYEVNIRGYPRFYMNWSPLGRYDVDGEDGSAIPYQLVLVVSDMLERRLKSNG